MIFWPVIFLARIPRVFQTSPLLGSRFRVLFINRLTTNAGYLLSEILKSNCYWFRADESSKKMDKFSTQHATDEWLISRACSSKILKSQLDLKRSTTHEGKLAAINVFGIGPMPVELVSCGTPFFLLFLNFRFETRVFIW